MRIALNTMLLCFLTFPLLALAEEPSVPNSSWFIGLGASLNAVNFDQGMFANGVGNVYQAGTLVAYGAAGGPAYPRDEIQWALAPEGQLGYLAQFAGSNWFMGAKFLYQYTDAVASTHDIDPQAGAFTSVMGVVTQFTGHVLIGSYRTRLKHQFAFMPFIGHSFARSNIYLGAGPALFATKTEVDDAIGFADVDGVHYDVTGTPANYASSQWVWGGAAQIGAAYYLDHGWFLDFNYTYARSQKFSSYLSAPFIGSSGGYQTIGTLFVSPTQRVTDQSFGVSINRDF